MIALEFIQSLWPTTTTEWLWHLMFGGVFTFLALTVMEHRIHLNLMHIKAMPKFVYDSVPFFSRFQRRHAVEHHQVFYRQFDHEPDPVGRHENINIRFYQTVLMGSAVLPATLILLFVSPVTFILFCAGGLTHNRLWNIMHSQMHMPENVFFRRWGLFRFVARHHFMHHVEPHRNLNVVLPCADWFFGTVAKPKIGDVREMLRLQYLEPRSARAKRLWGSMKPRHGVLSETATASAKVLPMPKRDGGGIDHNRVTALG